MEYFLILLIGYIAGTITGLIGASGVMVVVPALVLLGYSSAESIGASLFIDVVASLVVSWTYHQHKNLELKQGIWITIGSVIGAQVGSFLSPHIPDISLNRIFSVFLLLTAAMFITRSHKKVALDIPTTSSKNNNHHFHGILNFLRSHATASGLFLGFLVGIICGLLGAGGGVMILFILVFVMQYPLHKGIGTSTFIMAFTAASGAIGHALTADLPLMPSLIGAIGTVIGGFFSAKFAHKVNEKVLSKVVGCFFALLGIAMIITRR